MKLLKYIFFVFFLTACSPKISFYSGAANFKSTDGAPDYGKLEYWAAHPGKWDPSDTIPAPLKTRTVSRDADVFFVHPTTFTGQRENGTTNASIDDSVINYKTDYSSIIYQASAFNERARVFAPRYRQAHITMYQETDSIRKAAAFETAYQDVKAAFLLYLQQENKGRPIIIASHSQGTTHTKRLLKEMFDGKKLSDQLVCAYLIGMVVKKDEFKEIPVCTDSSNTGCMVSWRTFRYDYTDDWANRVDTSVVVVNPMSWGAGNELVGKELHKGAVLYNLKKVYTNTQSAQKEGNALWISHPRFPGSFLYRRKNYHAGDINLFYVDIRDDVSRRVDQFLKKPNQDQLKK
ncbi:MAG: DUF3089 domain-containing protein [bacterium]